MMEYSSLFVSVWLKFFFLLTPFFAVTIFLVMTKEMENSKRHFTALKTTAATVVICLFLYYFGNFLFKVFGITLDAFRIGAGSILFLTSISLVRESASPKNLDSKGDISVVPMAIPFIVGPGTIGALLVMGAETRAAKEHIIGCAALVGAIICVGTLLYLAVYVEKVIGKNGLNILSKISGLILSALAAQIIFTGIKNFLGL
jgi:multiple antibiotic resistance protein